MIGYGGCNEFLKSLKKTTHEFQGQEGFMNKYIGRGLATVGL